MGLTRSVKNFARSIFAECTFHALLETRIQNFLSSPLLNPHLFSVVLKRFELLTYKFFHFLGRSIIKVYFSPLHGTLVWISPLDRAPGHFPLPE